MRSLSSQSISCLLLRSKWLYYADDRHPFAMDASQWLILAHAHRRRPSALGLLWFKHAAYCRTSHWIRSTDGREYGELPRIRVWQRPDSPYAFSRPRAILVSLTLSRLSSLLRWKFKNPR